MQATVLHFAIVADTQEIAISVARMMSHSGPDGKKTYRFEVESKQGKTWYIVAKSIAPEQEESDVL